MRALLRICCFLLCITAGAADAQDYVLARPESGEGILALLRRYKLPDNGEVLLQFRQINTGKLGADGKSLTLNTWYRMPILRFAYNGKSIRTTLGFNDYGHAKRIQEYNEQVVRSRLKSRTYTADRDLWVPYHLVPENSVRVTDGSETRGELGAFPVFGSANSRVQIRDQHLAGKTFYLISGHGGPDPGAIGKRGSYYLCEDEYAYDITLRLARRLMEHSAQVYLIVRDGNDGIREDVVLPADKDEVYYGDKRIASGALTRLKQRAQIVNSLYRHNGRSRTDQTALILHVDSRTNTKRIDIFYYYQKNNKASKSLAKKLYSTINRKYSEKQPGRGYRGHVETRNLYMLRNVEPTTVYIELGNIKNSLDQDRLVIANNRQAVANWLCDGILDYHR